MCLPVFPIPRFECLSCHIVSGFSGSSGDEQLAPVIDKDRSPFLEDQAAAPLCSLPTSSLQLDVPFDLGVGASK